MIASCAVLLGTVEAVSKSAFRAEVQQPSVGNCLEFFLPQAVLEINQHRMGRTNQHRMRHANQHRMGHVFCDHSLVSGGLEPC